MKIVKYSAYGIVILSLIFGLNYGINYAKIGAAYNAKIACSCHFLSGRDIQSIDEQDLYKVPLASQKIDEAKKMVTSTVFGLISKSALYRPGLGCTLTNGKSQEELIAAEPEIKTLKNNVDLPDSTLPEEIKTKLNVALDAAMKEGKNGEKIQTRALVVLKNGKLVAEKYAEGFSKETPLTGWSMTKSITATMVGILVRDGILKTEQNNLFEDWKNDIRKSIKLDDLMRMSSGLEFDEKYGKISDATKMLFAEPATGKYAVSKPLIHDPGTFWSYSSGTTNVIQELIRSTFTEEKYYHEFPYRRLFYKLGIASATMETDPSGTFVGSSFMYANARDWAKLGQLYANDGIWNGEQILPPGWVSYVSKVTPASNGEYGAQFWTAARTFDLPDDCFSMNGFEGQVILIVPSKNLVIVRLGCTPDEENFDRKTLFESISAIL